MTEPILRPFRVEDLAGLVNRDGWQGTNLKLAIEQEREGPAFTGLIGETILGCAGVTLPWPGLGLAWMTLGAEANGYGMWLTRTVRRVLEDAIRAYRLHRVEAVALVDSERNQQWLEKLGFTREQHGIARAYLADGRDVVRYELIVQEKD